MGVVIICLFISREASVAKAYLICVAIGDLGHIYACYNATTPDVFWNFNDYNDLMWGNIVGSAFLWANRVLTLMGVFGRVKGFA